jgi:tyrosyl-tRNA synthetase
MNDEGAKAYAMTCPLITKADGSKFGKSEGGNIWLDADKTSVYKFYQFWLNTTDADAEKYIKIFTFLSEDEVNALIAEHQAAPHLRALQKKLAEEVTTFVHSKEDFEEAAKKSGFAFSNFNREDIENEGEGFFTDIFGEFMSPGAEITRQELSQGIDIVLALADTTNIFPSRGKAREAVLANAISINKEKIAEGYSLSEKDIILGKYILVQHGKKKYFVITVK